MCQTSLVTGGIAIYGTAKNLPFKEPIFHGKIDSKNKDVDNTTAWYVSRLQKQIMRKSKG
jgi:hypothetical protein